MPGDPLVFLRAQNENRAAAGGIAYGIICRPVSSFVETHADPRQATADLSACRCIIFTNAAGEDKQVDPIERSDHGGHLLAHGIAEHLDSKSCIGV